jgi:hypothetical protein
VFYDGGKTITYSSGIVFGTTTRPTYSTLTRHSPEDIHAANPTGSCEGLGTLGSVGQARQFFHLKD